MIRLRVELPFTPEQIEALVGVATIHGYLRENPRLRWSDRERHEAARFAMERLVTQGIKKWNERGHHND